jgi:hypothetical protein
MRGDARAQGDRKAKDGPGYVKAVNAALVVVKS